MISKYSCQFLRQSIPTIMCHDRALLSTSIERFVLRNTDMSHPSIQKSDMINDDHDSVEIPDILLVENDSDEISDMHDFGKTLYEYVLKGVLTGIIRSPGRINRPGDLRNTWNVSVCCIE